MREQTDQYSLGLVFIVLNPSWGEKPRVGWWPYT